MIAPTIKTLVSLVTGLFVSLQAYSAPNTRDIEVKVKFDQTFYSLKSNSKTLVYKEGPNEFSISIKSCNRSLVNSITEKYNALFLENSNKKNQLISKYDVKLIHPSGDIVQVARGDSFGTWLRDLPKKIMYYKAEAVAKCRR